MITISRVVCPVDFSDFSRHALEHAALVAKWYDARLLAVHVFPPPPSLDLPAAIEENSERERALGELRRFVASIDGVGNPDPELRAVAGSAIAKTIVSDAAETRADLLVLGSHGRAGFKRLLLGSVTEDVIRHATCPTLVVPRRIADDAAGPAAFRRVLCAVDFSDASLKALEYAMAIAEEGDAALTLLHVYAFPSDLLPPSSDDDAMAGLRELMQAERNRLETLVPDSLRTYCTVETVVRPGAVHHEILTAAAESKSDIIVMGVHCRGAFDVMMFGSNTARVVRAATCPVLIVPRG